MTEPGPPDAAKGRAGRARGADDAADHAGGRRRVATGRRRAAGELRRAGRVDETFGADQRPAPPVGLYVHIPFCVSLCPYCDFVVIAGAAARGPSNRLAAFAAALEREIGLRADALDARFGPPG